VFLNCIIELSYFFQLLWLVASANGQHSHFD
jgi:hypothetical protein